jgi:hypothetical protein
MAKAPGFYFYTGDWMKDPCVSLLSPAARGIWFDFICSMYERKRSGTITGTFEQLQRLGRCTGKQLRSALTEWVASQTADVDEHEGLIRVTNRRLQRECNARENTRKRVKDHRSRKKKQECNAPSSCSESLSPESDLKNQSLSLGGAKAPRRAAAHAASGSGLGNGAAGASGKSRFTLDECRNYARSLSDVRNPLAFGKVLHREGQDDDLIAAFLERGGRKETDEERYERLFARRSAQ